MKQSKIEWLGTSKPFRAKKEDYYRLVRVAMFYSNSYVEYKSNSGINKIMILINQMKLSDSVLNHFLTDIKLAWKHQLFFNYFYVMKEI